MVLAIVLAAILLCSALVSPLALITQQFMPKLRAPLSKFDFNFGSNVVYDSFVVPQGPGSGGGGGGVI